MEYITPEEVHHCDGAYSWNTGQDVLSAMDASVLNPSMCRLFEVRP